MHVAWLGKKSPFCGNVTYSREVTSALQDLGHAVSFFHFAQDEPAPDHWPEVLEGQDAVQEISIPYFLKYQIYTIPTLQSRKILTQALEELRPDVVHASLTLSPLDFALPEICGDLNIPLVATFHPAFDREQRNLSSRTQYLSYQLYAPCLARYDRVIVFSKLQRRLLMRLGVPPQRVVVIPNGVDIHKYSPGPSNFKAEIGAERVFLYQGRISPEKNVESLLKAWKHARMGTTAKLVIVGNHGALANSLMPFYGKEHGIEWLGFIADEQRRIEILRGSDVFVLPSLVEGLSLSLLEAMACGVACVATDVGADGEVLEQEAGVVLLRNQSVTTQLKTLLPLLRDHSQWTTTLGQNARRRVEDRYTLTDNIAKVVGLYDELVNERKHHQPMGHYFTSLRDRFNGSILRSGRT
ncbi:MAG: glycosyltransferase family 4 protein [Leptolyngbyaceae cyanobacterium bins.349]|nr:glycosyltransferase family 4 protein [Leptolyngbyaceae cyanobacterium bins.349]